MSDREHGAEDRLRDALHAKAQADDISTDAWAKIRGGVNAKAARRRTAVWTSLGLAGAAAAVIAVVSFAALSDDGDKQVVDTPADTDTGFVALTDDGDIVHYDATGRNLGVIAETEWAQGANFVQPEIAVSPDGTVFFSRHAPSMACDPGETENIVERTSEIVAVPFEGGKPEVVAEIGRSPVVSPDGSTLAYISHPSGERCPADTAALWIAEETIILLDLETGERTVPDISYTDADGRGVLPEGPLVWSPDGRELAVNVRCTASGGECEAASVSVVPAEGGEFRAVYSWGGDRGGPAAAFLDDSQLLVDTSNDVGDIGSVGIVDTEVTQPADAGSLAVPEFIALGEQTDPLTISTLPGANAPGVLVTTSNYADDTSAATVYHGQESREVLAEDVVAAAWIPGTTRDDLTSETSRTEEVDVSAEIPIDTAYLPGIGFSEGLAADESGVWVIVADDETGGSTGIVHISSETDEVDQRVDLAGVQSLRVIDGDLWFTTPNASGRLDPTTLTAGSESATTAERLRDEYRGELVATDTLVWTIAGQNSVAFFDRETGTAQGAIVLDGTIQRIVALGNDLWVEIDALPNMLSRLDTDTDELVDSVALPERNTVAYAVAGDTIWTIDTSGNLVPLVGAGEGDDPLATGIPSGRFIPTDEGLAVSDLDDRQVRRYAEDLHAIGGFLELPIPDRGDLDGPWGGMVIADGTAWWQNAVGPSILRFDL